MKYASSFAWAELSPPTKEAACWEMGQLGGLALDQGREIYRVTVSPRLFDILGKPLAATVQGHPDSIPLWVDAGRYDLDYPYWMTLHCGDKEKS